MDDHWALKRRILQTVEQSANSSRPASEPNFAGLLASFAVPKHANTHTAAARNNGALEDDVVTLTYEQALRNQTRHRADERGRETSAIQATRTDEIASAGSGETPHPASGRESRTASVTIRLSKSECAMLHQRAAEAGISVSAYLRSCVLEADALRKQVKDALLELKTAAKTDTAPAPVRRSWFGWLRQAAKK